MKILVIEDEPSLRETVVRALESEYVVQTADTFTAALRKTEDYNYDCILLDIMLPDGNGLRILEHLKALGKQGSVIVVSARDSVEDKVAGLELGADDYLTKPFSLAELTARIRSLIRRNQRGGVMTLELGNVCIDPAANRVFVAGNEIQLVRKEYDLLCYFVGRPDHLVCKEDLAEAVWGDHIDQVDDFSFVYAQIKNVRRKLREAGATAEIRSVYNFGYKMVVAEPV